ncbi:MAG: ABC transporter ATP-binding protein [Hyphomicrobium sp.]|nr:ABC transporter ATP-binding protein [Hyphomicrobium sp.]
MSALIEAEALLKTFGDIRAVDGISLSVKKGEVLGFLGPNGAGKSTTMKMITGFLEPDEGRARIAGHDVHRDPKAAKRQFGYVPEGAPAYGEMTAAGFLAFIGEVRGYRGSEIAKRVARAVGMTGLEPVVDQPIETLSKGYKRRVGLAQAILHDPPVLVMDEPTDGLDPNQKHQVRKLISDMASEKAIIISTHILEEVEAVCTRAVVINRGRIVADGTAEDLMRRMPYHGAVALRVPADSADRAIRILKASANVAGVERIGKADGHAQLRALPGRGGIDATGIAATLRAENIPVDELYVEKGRLVEVFREITSADGPPRASVDAAVSAKSGGRHA